MLIGHVSDSHFGTVDAPVARALQEDLRAADFDLLVFTGDLTQRARQSQFAAARDFLRRLEPTPHVVVPGNHDIPLVDLWTRFTDPYRNFARFIDSRLDPDYVGSIATVTCVNSTSPRRHKDGVLPPEKIATVAARIAASRHPFRVVALHHPLLVTLAEDETNRPEGADHALRVWTECGADLFLSGHIHLPFCVETAPHTGLRNALVLNAGTGISRRTRRGAPNSYNRIRLLAVGSGRAMHIERRDYDSGSRRFVTHSTHVAQDTAAGWRMRA